MYIIYYATMAGVQTFMCMCPKGFRLYIHILKPLPQHVLIWHKHLLTVVYILHIIYYTYIYISYRFVFPVIYVMFLIFDYLILGLKAHYSVS